MPATVRTYKVGPKVKIGPRSQELTRKTPGIAADRLAQYIQDQKITISRRTISGLQSADKWPDKYFSFVGSETRNNRYKDPNQFFRIMHFKPEFYRRKFIFRPVEDVSGVLREATLYAFRLIKEKSAQYGILTGFYDTSFRIDVDGSLATEASLKNLNAESGVRIYNRAAYASTIEAQAIYRKGIGGVIYYAANMVERRYPIVGVRFGFFQPEFISGTYSKYSVPVLQLGSRDQVVDKIVKPGKSIRREIRHKRRLRRK